MDIALKQASKEDCDLLFSWVNNESVRKNSFNQDKILYEDHIKWFDNRINSNECFIFILEEQDVPIGQVRIDIESKKTAIISYSIDENYRGRGLSLVMLTLLEKKIKCDFLNINKLIGFVKIENIASQKTFESLKFNKKTHSNFLEYEKYLV